MVQASKSALASQVLLFPEQPALKSIYDTAPIGLACLSPDCRYLQINQRLTEICGISVENHLGRFVRDCVPALAESVATIVRSIMETGEPVVGIEVVGQRPDQVEQRYWMTYWHPFCARRMVKLLRSTSLPRRSPNASARMKSCERRGTQPKLPCVVCARPRS